MESIILKWLEKEEVEILIYDILVVEDDEDIIKLLKISLSAMSMLLVLILLNNMISLNNSILTILLNGIVGAIIYFVACKILRIEEFNEAIDMIKSKLSKKEI